MNFRPNGLASQLALDYGVGDPNLVRKSHCLYVCTFIFCRNDLRGAVLLSFRVIVTSVACLTASSDIAGWLFLNSCDS
jgi:hypothetical protein